MRKTTRDILQVSLKDVSVIKFKVVQNQHLGPIVDKFASFVKKGEPYSSPSVTKGAFSTEVHFRKVDPSGTPPMKIARFLSCLGKGKGGKGVVGSFAMGTGNYHRRTVADEGPPDQLREGNKIDPTGTEQIFDLWISTEKQHFTTTRSGCRVSISCSAKPSNKGIPADSSTSDMGG